MNLTPLPTKPGRRESRRESRRSSSSKTPIRGLIQENRRREVTYLEHGIREKAKLGAVVRKKPSAQRKQQEEGCWRVGRTGRMNQRLESLRQSILQIDQQVNNLVEYIWILTEYF